MQSYEGRKKGRAHITAMFWRGQLHDKVPWNAESDLRSLQRIQEDAKIPGGTRLARTFIDKILQPSHVT